ncbi:MAG: BamA/TamA family outer membrane protein [Bacteroidota bacterium]
MKLTRYFLMPFFLLSFLCLAEAQTDTLSSKKTKSYDLIGLPVLFYQPETRLGYGAVGLLTFRFPGAAPTDRPSQLQLGVAYTLEKQLLTYLPFNIFTKGQRYYFYGRIDYFRFFYPFFGIGNETAEEQRETYGVNFPRLRLNALKRMGASDWYLGLRYWFDDYNVRQQSEGGLLEAGNISGSEGSLISALGLIAIYDNRNYVFYPSRGWYIESLILLSDKALGASHGYQRLSVDMAKYIELGSEEKILATNVFVDFTFGDTPFQELPLIGGIRKMRGFIQGRYRDEKLLMLQTEYRFPVYKFLNMAVFAAGGQVAPRLRDFKINDWHYSYGAGLRIRINKKDKVHIRFDIGIDEKGTFLPYVTFNEAF